MTSRKPRTYKLESGDVVVAGTVLALMDVDIMEDEDHDGPLTLAVAMTTDAEWIPVYICGANNWTRPSVESVTQLGRIIISDWVYQGIPDLESGLALFRRWAEVIPDDLNGYTCAAIYELDELAAKAEKR